MAKQFTIPGLSDSIKDFNKFNAELKESVKELGLIALEAEKMKASFNQINGLKHYLDYLQKINNEKKEVATTTTKLTETQKALERAEKQLLLAQSQEGELLAKLRVRTAQLNQENKQNAKLTLATVGAYEKLATQLAQSQKRTKDLAVQYGATSKEARQAAKETNALYKSVYEIDKLANQSQRNVGNYTSALGNIGKNLIGAFGIVGGVSLFADVVKGAVNTVREFDSAQSNLAAILGSSKNDVKELTTLTLQLGSTTAFTATEATNAAIELSKLGFTSDEIKASLGGILNGAIAMGVGIQDAAELTSKTLRAFKLDASEAEAVVSALAVAGNRTALDFEYLNDALPYASTGASQLGFTVEQTAAFLGVLADNGIKASQAGTSMRDIFADLSVKGLTLDEAMERINNSTDKSKTAFELFGKTSLNAAIILSENKDRINDLSEAFTGQQNALQQLIDTRMDNLNGDLKLLTSAWEGLILGIENGNGVLGGLSRMLIQNATDLLNVLTPTQDLTEAIRNEQLELNVLANKITSSNITNKERGVLIRELNAKYPELLRNMDLEKVSNGDIRNEISKVNEEYVKKIALQEETMRLEKAQKKEAEASLEKAKMQIELEEELIRVQGELAKKGVRVNLDFGDYEGTLDAINEGIAKANKGGGALSAIFGGVNTNAGALLSYVNATDISLNKAKATTTQVGNEVDKVAAKLGGAATQSKEMQQALANLASVLAKGTPSANNTTPTADNTPIIPSAPRRTVSSGSGGVKRNAEEDAKTKAQNQIKALKDELDYFILIESEKERLMNESLQYYTSVEQSKIDIYKKELDNKIISEKEYLIKVKEAQKETETALNKNKLDILGINEDNAQQALDTFQLVNQSVLDNTEMITDKIIEAENKRLDALLALQIDYVTAKYDAEIEAARQARKDITDLEKQKEATIKNLSNDTARQKNENIESLFNTEFEYQQKALAIEYITKRASATNKEEIDAEYYERLRELELRHLEGQYGINKEQIELKLAINEKLTEAELRYYELMQEKSAETDEKKLRSYEEVASNIGKLIGKENETVALANAYQQFMNAKTTKDKLGAVAAGAEATANILGKETAAGKAAAIAAAIINTYSAAAAALAPPPIGAGPLFGPILAGTSIALGLLQVGKIMSTPVPKFAIGTEYAPYSGLAIVDEKGAEIHTDAKGNVKSYGQDGGARYTYVNKGDKIIPADKSKKILNEFMSTYSMSNIQPNVALSIDYDLLGNKIGKEFKSALKNDVRTQFIQDKKGNFVEIITYNGNKKVRYHNEHKRSTPFLP